MTYCFRRLISPIAAMVAVLAMGMATPARADLQIWLSESSPLISSNKVAEASTPGSVGYSNSSFDGNLNIQMTSGSSDSPGSSTFASLSSATTELKNFSSSAVTVYLSIGATAYTAPTAPPTISVLSSVSATVLQAGTGSNSLSFSSYVNQDNGQNDTTGSNGGSQSLNISSTGSPGTSTTFNVSSLSSPYSITETYAITLSAVAYITLDASTGLSQTAVPEPSTMAIAGLGALGMIGYGIRRRKSA